MGGVRRQSRRKKGYVYFIAPEACLWRPDGNEGRRVKIGFTSGEPDSRLRTLRTGSPLTLVLWAYVRGTPELEAALHETFAPLRCHGEWFVADHKLQDMLCYLGDEPGIGNLISEDAFESALFDNVFSHCAPHPLVPEKEYLASANAEALARLYPDLWKESKLSQREARP